MDRVDQLSGGGVYPHEDCGETCVDSIKIDDGKPDTVRAEEVFDQFHGDNPDDGTAGDVHVLSLGSVGIPAHVEWGDYASIIPRCVKSGLNRIMFAIRCNHSGDPLAGSDLTHWVLTDGNEVMNPIMGRLLDSAYLKWCLSTQINYGVVIDRWIGPRINPPSPTPVASKEDPDMVKLCGSGQPSDPHGAGAIYLVVNYPYGPKRHIASPGDLQEYLNTGLKIETCSAYLLDRMEDGPEIASGQYPKEV